MSLTVRAAAKINLLLGVGAGPHDVLRAGLPVAAAVAVACAVAILKIAILS